jgi:hexosaminidase
VIGLLLAGGSGRRVTAGENPLEPLGLIPRPARIQRQPGTWTLTRTTRLVAHGVAAAEARTLAAALSPALGWTVPVGDEPAGEGDVELSLVPSDGGFSGEGYRLSVAPGRVVLRAATPAGLFYGGITLRQLLPASVLNPTRMAVPPERGWTVPCVEIEDQPRFGWRGLLLDPARHWLPPDAVQRFIDLMALHKLNSLQLHLTDDQGWRLEIRRYPRLTAIGSVRRESPRRGDRDRGDGTPYGPFFYTQEQIRDLVAYAGARHITVVPEIEIPGHFRAALAAHPEFSCTGGPFEVGTRWGVEPDILCPGNDAAVAFALHVLGEVCDLFPGRFIHIGGDEAPRDRWKQCPKCQARIRAEGLQGEAQLQTWLNRRLEEFLARRGRRMIGWDEILEGGLTPGAAVMSWRGMEGGLAAARAGHDVVMSPTTHCYFDYAQARGPGEPESIGGFIPLATVYAFEPVPPALPAGKRGHILGAQANLWSEFLWTLQDVEYRAFPRAAALAEVLWSPAGAASFPEFERRLEVHTPRLAALGVNFRRSPGLAK